ncbi:MAG: DUF2267 domain-containing protein [Myxococcota bacterium]
MAVAGMLQRIQERAALASVQDAERVTRAVLESLGARLLEIDAEVVARRLPPAWAAWLRRPHEGDFSLVELYRRVAERQGVEVREVIEHVAVVCQVVAESVDEVACKHLRMRLPEDFAALFTSRQRRSNVAHVPGGRGALPHRHSVMRSDNPHADRKLSSTGKS